METRFYFDTSIWLDVYEERNKNGEIAIQFTQKIILEDYIVLYSDAVIKELKNLGYSDYEILETFRMLKPNNLRKVHISSEQIKQSKKIAIQRNLPKRDVLHAVLARDNEAILITRDLDFQRLRDIITPKRPEEFI